jgi:hypothetical protein
MSDERVSVRLLFADSGAFHTLDLELPAMNLEGYDRLIDGLQEDQALLKEVYLDVGRLCAAWVVDDQH